MGRWRKHRRGIINRPDDFHLSTNHHFAGAQGVGTSANPLLFPPMWHVAKSRHLSTAGCVGGYPVTSVGTTSALRADPNEVYRRRRTANHSVADDVVVGLEVCIWQAQMTILKMYKLSMR